MATEHLSQLRRPRPQGDAKLLSYDEYIDTQVESTRRLVKLVDLATSLVVLATGVLAFLLVFAVVEHWLVPGGFPIAVRAILFVLLAGSVSYFAYRRLGPLVMRAINPVYAAQAIEVAAATGPSLKNSLVNLLLFRQRRSEISDAVYQTLEEQAAQRLSRVPLDAAVDRTLLIRFGYVLLAVVAVASLYKVLSPKDPLIAAQRVLMPWADIVPASRVSIADVEPGTVTVSRGEFVNVSAEVRGVGENDPVLLRYTTDDGQAVKKPVTMKLSKDGPRFEARLPDEDFAAGGVGLAQNLRYWLEAGDARSLTYDVTVVAAPSILIERVEYDYPSYTRYENRHLDGLGDIRAIEGTRVTIHARANGPIQEAHVDFDADGRRDLRMAVDETEARASFELQLRDDRITPRHASYLLRFTNREGRSNQNPVKHRIHVEPDIGPEASILWPQEKELQVRLDETVAIEVEGRDPDFALSEVRLRGEVNGREVLSEALLSREHRGRFTGRYQFTPSAHDLRAGDVMHYWVAASDNRTPRPNTAASERKLLRIISADPAQQPPPDQIAQNDPRRRQQEQQPGEEQQNGQQQEGAGGEEDRGGEPQPDARGGEGQRGDPQQPQNEGGEGQPNAEQPPSRDAERSADGGQGDEQPPRQEEQAKGEGGEHGAGERQGAPSDQQSGEGGQPDRRARPGERDSNDKQTGAGAAGGESAQDGSQPDGARPDQNLGERPMDGRRHNGDAEPGSSAEPAPVSSEGDNDAEAFERIRRHLRQEGELPEGDSASRSENRDDARTEAEQSAERGQGDKETRKQGEAGGEDAPAREQPALSNDRTDDRAGRGTDTKGKELEQAEKEPGERPTEKKDLPGREPSGDEASGAGDEQRPQGPPDSQQELKRGEKRQQSPSRTEDTDETESPAGARGKKESDSQGEQGGDRAGGGEEGGGQDAPREGTGSAGQNQAADEGAGESMEPGGGSDSPTAGNESSAEDRTGEPGDRTVGRGSKQRDGEGQQPGGKGEEGDAEPSEQQRQKNGRSGKQEEADDKDAATRPPRDADNRQNGSGSTTGGGGERGTAAGPPPSVEGTVPEGDEANLDYARKQTDLVLEKLAEQLNRKGVDDELLEELGWSEDDLRRFVERWQSRKEAAQREDQSGKAAKRELDEALRSLGLRRGPLQQGPLKEDALRDLREGYRGKVPLEYQERLRAYNQGVSRARRDGE